MDTPSIEKHTSAIEAATAKLVELEPKVKQFKADGKTPLTHSDQWNKLCRAFKKSQYTISGLSWEELAELSAEQVAELLAKQRAYQELVNKIKKVN